MAIPRVSNEFSADPSLLKNSNVNKASSADTSVALEALKGTETTNVGSSEFSAVSKGGEEAISSALDTLNISSEHAGKAEKVAAVPHASLTLEQMVDEIVDFEIELALGSLDKTLPLIVPTIEKVMTANQNHIESTLSNLPGGEEKGVEVTGALDAFGKDFAAGASLRIESIFSLKEDIRKVFKENKSRYSTKFLEILSPEGLIAYHGFISNPVALTFMLNKLDGGQMLGNDLMQLLPQIFEKVASKAKESSAK